MRETMTKLCALCFEIIHLLIEYIEPKIEYDINTNSCRLVNKNEMGLICILQFIETLRNSDHYIRIEGDELYYKLVELANAIVTTDFGEISIFQNYLYDRINGICELLKPDQFNSRQVPVNKVFTQSFETDIQMFYTKVDFDEDSFDEDDDDSVILLHTEGSDIDSQDTLYIKISELFDISTERNPKTKDIFSRIDNIINSFNLKSSIHSKCMLWNRVKDVNDAINLLSESDDNVTYTTFVKFQVDEIYTLLKKDMLCGNVSSFVKIKIKFLSIINDIRNVSTDFFSKVKYKYETMRKYLINHIREFYFKHKESNECLSVLIIILLNLLIFGIIIII